MKHIFLVGLVTISFSLFSCGKKQEDQSVATLQGEPVCQKNCDEPSLNAPVEGEEPTPPEPIVDLPVQGGPIQIGEYRMPQFQTSWGIPRELYEKTARYYDAYGRNLRNPRFVTIIDFTQHSSKKRFYLFDLKNKVIERHLTAHGQGSDRDKDGYATSFSNAPGSLKSSLGIYITATTYRGKNGRSLRLVGKEPTNSNAYSRAIVIHGAKYVNEKEGRAGRSWGCPALDHAYAQKIIDKIENGSLLVIGKQT